MACAVCLAAQPLSAVQGACKYPCCRTHVTHSNLASSRKLVTGPVWRARGVESVTCLRCSRRRFGLTVLSGGSPWKTRGTVSAELAGRAADFRWRGKGSYATSFGSGTAITKIKTLRVHLEAASREATFSTLRVDNWHAQRFDLFYVTYVCADRFGSPHALCSVTAARAARTSCHGHAVKRCDEFWRWSWRWCWCWCWCWRRGGFRCWRCAGACRRCAGRCA